MTSVKCNQCDSFLVAVESYRNIDGKVAPMEMATLVGYRSPPGHNHDNNCRTRVYLCENDHQNSVSVQNKCNNPDCSWVGKVACFCHPNTKFSSWPVVEKMVVVYDHKKVLK